MQPTKRETDEAGLRPTLLVDGDASPRADDDADAGGAILTLLPRAPASRFQREREFNFFSAEAQMLVAVPVGGGPRAIINLYQTSADPKPSVTEHIRRGRLTTRQADTDPPPRGSD